MYPVSGFRSQISFRKEYVLVGSLVIGFALRGWVGALGSGAAYFIGKKIYQSCHCPHAAQNIYSRLFGPSQEQAASVQKDSSLKVALKPMVQKVNDNLYIARRVQDKDLFFVMVRLTDENLGVWWNLHQRRACVLKEGPLRKLWDDKWTKDQKRFILSDAGGMAFRNTLQMYEESQGKPVRPEVWISYVLSGMDIDPSQPMQEEQFPHVEMAMTALTHPDVPFVVHMGIGRTIYNLKKVYDGELPQHKALSIPLHAFTAKAMLSTPQGHSKVWMRTRPTFDMGHILDQNLPEKSFLKESENMPMLYNADGSLTVKDAEGQIISNFTKEDLTSGKLTFYEHPEMDQPLPDYAVQYESLAGIF